MPKPKTSPALFELLREKSGRVSEAVSLPRWLRPGGAPPGEAPDPAAERTPPPEPSHVRLVRERDEPPRLFEIDGAVLRIALTSKSGAVALLVGMLALCLSYALGRNAGGTEQAPSPTSSAAIPDALDHVRSQPPNSQLVTALSPSETTSTAPVVPTPARSAPQTAVASVRWQKGLTYIVAQEFGENQTDAAHRASEYLAQFGIATEVVRLSNGVVQLITAEGYNRKEPAQVAQSDDVLKRIHAAGEKYFTAGGGYRLKGYFKTLKGDGW